MGWSWAAACGMQGWGVLHGFPHSLLFAGRHAKEALEIPLCQRDGLGWFERERADSEIHLWTDEDVAGYLTSSVSSNSHQQIFTFSGCQDTVSTTATSLRTNMPSKWLPSRMTRLSVSLFVPQSQQLTV